jgi:hypothetical protein
MTVRLKRRPPTAADVAVERWERVPAEIGSGSWLVATGASTVRIWAPPGVVLTGEPGERLERWTMVATAAAAPVTVTLADVLAAVPPDFHGWAREVTADQLRVLGLYVAEAGEEDPYTAFARATRRILSDELAAVDRPVRVPPAPADAAPTPDVYAALTDTEFSTVVRSLVEKVFSAFVEGVRETAAGDAIVASAAGVRHLVQVEHHPDGDVGEFVRRTRCNALDLRDAPSDVHWVVTSRRVGTRVRRELLHTVGPWLAERHRVIDADDLTRWLRAHPSVERQLPKVRAARGGLPVRELARLAATEALDDARRQLHETGVVVITGRPGTGKSALMSMLVADAAVDDFRPSPATPALVASGDRRIVFWDDADDADLLRRLLGAVRRSDDVCLVVATTNDRTILRENADAAIVLGHYGLRDRANVYYNHVWNADHLHPEARSALAEPVVYQAVLEHPHFTPRLAQHVANQGPVVLADLQPLGCPGQPDPHVDQMFTRIRRRPLAHLGCWTLFRS